MNALLVGDLHLTTLPRDAYRWQVFAHIKRILEERKAKHLILLGDITDEKDRHAAELVNKVCDNIADCVRLRADRTIHIVRGNHDGIDPNWPYFRFLNGFRGVYFYAEPTEMFGVRDALILPHSRDPLKEWSKIQFNTYRTVFAHVTVEGAESESGFALQSVVSADYFRQREVKVYSGDVHVPQKIGPVLYVGAPYAIRFGDKFKPRLIYLSGDKEISIDLPTIARRMLDLKDASELAKVKVTDGDQAKVRLHLPEDRLGEWLDQRKAIVAACRKIGLDLVSVEVVREEGVRPILEVQRATKEPQDVLKKYVQQQKVSFAYARVGKRLLESAQISPGSAANAGSATKHADGAL